MAATVASFVESAIFHNHGVNVSSEITRERERQREREFESFQWGRHFLSEIRGGNLPVNEHRQENDGDQEHDENSNCRD